MSDKILQETHYDHFEDKYLEKRQLGKGTRANWWLLWGGAVGAVMFGLFAGWQEGLAAGGFFGMVLANLLIALMYGGLVFSVAELSTALPHAGGFYSYVRYAFGPLAGFVCGVAVTMQYVFLAAVSVGMIAQQLSTTLGQPTYLWALLLYAIFVAIIIRGRRVTFGMLSLFGMLSIAILIIFSFLVLYTGSFQIESLFDVPAEPDQSSLMPKGWWGMFAALPFAIWFYLPLEQIAFAAEEVYHPTEEIPAALKRGFATLFGLSFLALLFISGSGGGALAVSDSLQPVPETLTAIFGGYKVYFTLITMVALFASALAFINTSGRIIFALSRAGYFPREISLTGRYQTPSRALILAAVVGWLSFYLLEFSGTGYGRLYLTNMAIFNAMLSYLLVMGSYMQLKSEHPELPRPYKSPLSEWGAVLAFVVAFIILLAFLMQPDFRIGVIAVGFIVLFFALDFVFFLSQHLVLDAPEEKQALRAESKPIMVARLTVTRAAVLILVLAFFRFAITFGITTFTLQCPPLCMGASMIRENFRGDLRGLNFIEANLLQSNFDKADLRGADLSGANLANASLANADLSGAKLIGANLTGADLGGAIMNHTDLRGANLNQSNLTNVDLTSARLDGIYLVKARLTGADLSGVNLAGVWFTSAQMKQINLSGANLAGSTFSGADLSGSTLSGANLTGAWLNLTNLTGADLSGADLSGVTLIGANLSSADLSNSEMAGSTIIGATFSGANLAGANLKEVRFRESELNELDLELDSVLLELNQLGREKIIKDANLSGVQSNNQTIWPSSEFLSSLALDIEEKQEGSEFSEDSIKVGLLYSLTGPMAISEQSMRNGTLLAIDEINAAGGVFGRQLEPVIEDGASSGIMFMRKTRKHLEENDVDVIFGGSRYVHLLSPVLAELNKGLLFSSTSSQGFETSPHVFYIGSDPAQQIVPAVRYLLNQGHKKIFLLSTNDLYGDRVNLIVKAMLADTSANIVGEGLVALEESDFSTIIGQIESTEPTAIFNTMAGSSNIAFFKQLKVAGFTPEQLAVMSVSVSEQEVRGIGIDNYAGYFTSWNYYQSKNSTLNNIFVKKYKLLHGQDSVTSAPIHASYAAVYLWNELLKSAGSTDFRAIIEAAASNKIEYAAPGGLIRLDGETHYTYLPARIGVVRENGLIEEVIPTEELIKPDPFLSQYEWAESLSEAILGK